jgi:hypothetical protein
MVMVIVMKFLIAVVIVLLIILLHYYYSKETKWVKSDLDNNWYLIKGSKLTSEQMIENANTLAEINRRVVLLIDHTKDIYPKLQELYNPKNLTEAAIDDRYTTFTLDKRDIHVCLRTRNDHQHLYDIDRLMYVVIHELAHMANWDRVTGQPIIGHGKEFISIFRDLVKRSIRLKIYNYRDYKESPVEYCGIIINSNVV